MAAVRITLHT